MRIIALCLLFLLGGCEVSTQVTSSQSTPNKYERRRSIMDNVETANDYRKAGFEWTKEFYDGRTHEADMVFAMNAIACFMAAEAKEKEY